MINYQPREWQRRAFEAVSRCNASNVKNAIPVNACVGSGKTAVASYALGDFIVKNKDKKTFQMFVTPRIKLCKQQAGSIEEDLRAMFGIANGKDRFDGNIECHYHAICDNCGKKVSKLGYSCRNHCPFCLHSKHVDVNPGDRAEDCHGDLEPVGAELDSKKGYVIIFKCKKCGKLRRNKAAEDDNIDLIIKLAAMHNY